MPSNKFPGTTFSRANGKITALSPEAYDWTTGTRRRISLGTFDRQEDANKALLAFDESKNRSAFALSTVELRRTRLGVYLRDWLSLIDQQHEAGELAGRTVSSYRSAIVLHVAPVLGGYEIGDLNHVLIHRWLLDLRRFKGLSDRTVLRVYRTLHRALEDAPLAENPVALPKHMRPRVRVEKARTRPAPEEIRRFLDHTMECPSSRYLDALWRVAAVTGLRRGELIAVTWQDVDMDNGRLAVVRSIVRDEGKIFVKSPKSEAGSRTVVLDPTTIEALRRLRLQTHEDRLRAGEGYDQLPLGLDLVFRWNASGNYCSPDGVSHAFSAEWAHSSNEQGVTLHSLRRSFASILLGNGHSVTETAAHLGHTPAVLLAIYGRDLDLDRRLERVGETVSGLFG